MKTQDRYLEYFGLRYNPFPIAPDTKYFFCSRWIDQIVTELVHCIEAKKGFMVLVGEVGLGKTTIGKKVLGVLERKGIHTSWVFNTRCQGPDLLREIIADFGLQIQGDDYSGLLKGLNEFLLERGRKGENCALLIDDAQNLDVESLEMVRMLSSLETDTEKLLQIILIGQPELLEKLNAPELRQLKSRIVIQKQVRPLSRNELMKYIIFKLTCAGNTGSLSVTRVALNYIHRVTKGNLRKVNILMDRCLYAGFMMGTTTIGYRVAKLAWKDLEASRKKRFKPYWALASIALLLLGAGFLHFSGKDTGSIAGNLEAGVELSPGDPFAKSVMEFLQAYGLKEYASQFLSALKNNELEPITKKIQKAEGLELIALENLPAFVRNRFGVLSYSIEPNHKSRYFLFWRPELQLKHFYFGYRGTEVTRLQKLLASLDYYRDDIDGIVGPNLMRAVVRFQDDMGLEVNGYPDSTTIFLLNTLKELARHGESKARQKTAG